MKKKERREIIQQSLLENPNMETQVKDKPYRLVLRVLAILLLFSVIIFGYLSKFTINFFPNYFSHYCTGTFNADNFYKANDCDLIVFDRYKEISDIKVGDIVVYSSNLGKGSGRVLKNDHGVVEIETKKGETKRISETIVVGKQVKTIAAIGFLIEFIGSYYGIITFNILLIAYIAYLTFSRINYENTSHGKMLYKKFRQAQKEERNRLRLLRKIKGIDDITYVIVSMLEGSFEENKEKFLAFNKETKTGLKEKYKYILNSVHNAYLPNEDLTRSEKKQISSVVELMCVCQDMDMDIEYMVVDLLLKTPLIEFDTENFAKEAQEFLKSKLDDDDLLNFGSVLYILIYKNKRLRDEHIKNLAECYLEKTKETTSLDKEIVVNTAQSIIKLLK